MIDSAIAVHTSNFKYFFVKKTPRLTILILKITAAIVSFFGQSGRCFAKKLRFKAARIQASEIKYNLVPNRPPFPVLVPLINQVNRDCILKAEDSKAARALRDRYLQQKDLDPDLKKSLSRINFNKAKVKGICNGATLLILKRAIEAKVSSEAQLIAILKESQNGFTSEAAGLQTLYAKRSKILKRRALNPFIEILKNDSKLKKPTRLESIFLSKQQKLDNKKTIEEFRKLVAKASRQAQVEADDLRHLCSLFQIDQERTVTSFTGLEQKEFLQIQFNDLPQGFYKLDIETETQSGGHVLAYLKYDFGSYLIDSNFGLARCSLKPSNELIALLKEYPGPKKDLITEEPMEFRDINMTAFRSL